MRHQLLLVLYKLSSFLTFKKIGAHYGGSANGLLLQENRHEADWLELISMHFPQQWQLSNVCVCGYCMYVPSLLCVDLHVLPGWKVFGMQSCKESYCCSQKPTSCSQANGIKRRHMVTEESGEVGIRMPTCAVFVYLEGHIYSDVCRASVGHLTCQRQPLKLCVCLCLFYTVYVWVWMRHNLCCWNLEFKVICQFERPSCLLLFSSFCGCALTTNTVLGVCW